MMKMKNLYYLKNCFPTIFGVHLEFLHKPQKHIYLRNGATWSICHEIFDLQGLKDRDFSEIFGPQGVCSHLALFAKNRFPAIFFGHLEILHEMQKCISLGKGAR